MRPPAAGGGRSVMGLSAVARVAEGAAILAVCRAAGNSTNDAGFGILRPRPNASSEAHHGASVNQKTVIVLCVSREILEGAVVDRNAAFMAARVTDLGFRVRSMQVLDRVENEMVASLKWALETKPAYVLVTGGIGP